MAARERTSKKKKKNQRERKKKKGENDLSRGANKFFFGRQFGIAKARVL